VFPARRGDVVALQEVTLTVAEGEFVAIVGASGSGKSTLLNLVAGFERPTAGAVLVDGKPVSGPGPDRGVFFQQSALFPWLSVRENVGFGLKLAANRHHARPGRVDELLKRVGLSRFEHQFPAQLSGGMRQRAAIASVLAIDPAVMLMDEPFGALDALTRSLMQDFLLEIWEENRKTVMLVTHDISEAIYLADRVVVMAGHPGRVREIVPVDLPRPRKLASQGLPRFIELREHVTAVVRDEVVRANEVEAQGL
jgi:ABC-type nitrate/sulfonate/bicarbonate transport system ATPase subunit